MVHLFQSFRKTGETGYLLSDGVALKLTENGRTNVGCVIKADKDNAGIVYIGGQDVTANGYPLEAGEKLNDVIIPLLDEIFVSFSNAGDKIYILQYEDPHIHRIRELIFSKYGQEYLGKQQPNNGAKH